MSCIQFPPIMDVTSTLLNLALWITVAQLHKVGHLHLFCATVMEPPCSVPCLPQNSFFLSLSATIFIFLIIAKLSNFHQLQEDSFHWNAVQWMVTSNSVPSKWQPSCSRLHQNPMKFMWMWFTFEIGTKIHYIICIINIIDSHTKPLWLQGMTEWPGSIQQRITYDDLNCLQHNYEQWCLDQPKAS